MPGKIEELMRQRPEAEFAVEFTPRNLAEFHERGFTTIERITTDAELQWLREVYDQLFVERAQLFPGAHVDLVQPVGGADGDLQAQILLPENRFPELRKTAFWRNGRALASALLGIELPEVRGWGHMIRKPPLDGCELPLPWHQDEAYWDRSFKYKALACWMPLDPATLDSGCMSYIPGSHRSGVREHQRAGDGYARHVVGVEGVDSSLAIAAPVPAGGAVFHHCRTLHSSGPNRSERERRAYANEWQLEPVKKPTGEAARLSV